MAMTEMNYVSGGGISGYTNLYGTESSNPSYTLNTASYIGKPILVLLYTWAGSGTLSKTYCDGATCTGGTITKIDNLTQSNAQVTGTYYNLVPSSSSCVIAQTNAPAISVYVAE